MSKVWTAKPMKDGMGPNGWRIFDHVGNTRGWFMYLHTSEPKQISGALLLSLPEAPGAGEIQVVTKMLWTPGAEPSMTPEGAAKRLQAELEE